MSISKNFSRKDFIKTTGALAGGAMFASPFAGKAATIFREKRKMCLVGTGVRGISMFGRRVREVYPDTVDLAAICDINPGRLRYAREYIGGNLPAYTNLEEMLREHKPDTLIVTSRDDVHHEHIITGMRMGCDIITEKPLTIDETRAQQILDAERIYGKQIIVTFNYRYPPYRAKIKELIMDGWIGKPTSVDFHWHITHSHLMRYMQRWHGHRQFGGSLWVHKSTHHFDMVNWFINSDPVEVYANASLDRFGKQGPFRGKNCRNCAFTDQCEYHWDINDNAHLKGLYADNEQYDGYIRDNCVFRETIDIFDKHSAIVNYANGATLNYSLTADTEYEGYTLAINGTEGRVEVRAGGWPRKSSEDVIFMPNRRYSNREEQIFNVEHGEGGHWGGDPIMNDQLFKDPDRHDPLGQQAGTRDGVMSILTGVAARKSVDSGKLIRISDLTDLTPSADRT